MNKCKHYYRLLSDFITIIASNELMGELTIAFQIANETKYVSYIE